MLYFFFFDERVDAMLLGYHALLGNLQQERVYYTFPATQG